MDSVTATRMAEQHVAELSRNGGLTLRLLSERTVEREFGWIFFFAPQNPSVLVAGNAPFIVDRHDQSIHATGTAYPTETYLESYARVGRTFPLAVAEHLVVLEGWRPGILKVSLTKAIRGATGKSLREAKDCTDAVLAGESVMLTFATAKNADQFCSDVQQMGAVARRETRYS